ncbi:MAG: hypothetical protein M0040_04550 [Actinomycetota bacterium]|nr:hypothetical protein [Actinomycetota bacterium]
MVWATGALPPPQAVAPALPPADVPEPELADRPAPNPPAPNPAQPFGPGDEMATERAATAPVELAGPSARTHLPTARSVGAAGSVSEKLVDDVVSTVTVRWASVLGLVVVTVNDVPVVAAT